MNRALRTLAVPVTVAAVLTAAACGSSTTPTGAATSSTSSSPGSTSATSSVHNTADVTFATDMIPHHAQAVQMADTALQQAKSAKVTALAEAIKAAQDPEIKTMTGWLTAWGKPTSMSGHDKSSMSGMGGMMSTTQMSALGKATGAGFDRMWLQLMTKHHQGAVAMARTELAHGANPDAKTLARSIITSQDQQITQMRSLLTTLGS